MADSGLDSMRYSKVISNLDLWKGFPRVRCCRIAAGRAGYHNIYRKIREDSHVPRNRSRVGSRQCYRWASDWWCSNRPCKLEYAITKTSSINELTLIQDGVSGCMCLWLTLAIHM